MIMVVIVVALTFLMSLLEINSINLLLVMERKVTILDIVSLFPVIMLVVGANGDDNDNGIDSGSAYIFDVTTETQLHKLIASDGAASDYFGYSVAISGNYAIVGAYGDDDNGSSSGSAYIFDVTTGTELRKLTASDAVAGDQFGNSVAIDGHYAIVAAKYKDDNGSNSGSAIFGPSSTASVPILSITDNKNMVVNGNVGIGTTSPNYLGNNEPTKFN